MAMSRSEKRACRREAFLRSAEAKVTMTGGAKKRRVSRTRVQLRRALLATTMVMTFLVIYSAKPAMAGTNLDVPEIDPGSIASAMTLLIGGVLSLTGRVRRV